MSVDEIENLAKLLKGNEGAIAQGVKRVSITSHILDQINSLVNFHIKQLMINNPTCIDITDQNSTETTKKSIQIIYRLLQTITYLKLIADVVNVENTVDLSEFKSLKVLEVQKVEISKITGINSLRLHLHELVCVRCVDTLKELLEDCGGDFSSKSVWAELKKLSLPYNSLTFLDNSLECTPWLTSLDLSHNNLTSANEVTLLINLKLLNLAYNKLQSLPRFSGQICNRLQILNVSNNFLEEIMELKNLLNISELDLSENCLIDHSVLVSISHMATLQWLSLIGNPLYYHTRHARNTCVYLHSNIEPQRFILDYIHLTNGDIKCVGTFHPLMQKSNSESLQASGGSTKFLASTEKYRRVREVDIEDNRSVDKEPPPLPASFSSVDHLEVKNVIQNLRETYGESWLNYYNGLKEKDDSINRSQDISGFGLLDETTDENEDRKEIEVEVEINNTIVNDEEAELTIYNTANDDTSEDEDIEVNSEETIFMVKVPGEEDDLFVVFTEDALTEIDCTTSKERATWVLNTIIGCEFLDDFHTTVLLSFDTLRKDKKHRIYILSEEEADKLFTLVTKLISGRKKPVVIKVLKCMKCLKQFPKNDDLLSSYKEITECSSCGSTILVEEEVDSVDQ